MSTMANPTPIVTTVIKTTNKEKASDAAPRVNIQDFCEEHYEDILPIIMEKARCDKRKEVQTRLNFGENSKRTRREREHSLNSRVENSPARFHLERSWTRGRERRGKIASHCQNVFSSHSRPSIEGSKGRKSYDNEATLSDTLRYAKVQQSPWHLSRDRFGELAFLLVSKILPRVAPQQPPQPWVLWCEGDEDTDHHRLTVTANDPPESIAEPTTAEKMSADVARGHGGDGGGDDRPPSHHIPTGCGGCLGNRGKGTRKPNLGGRRAGRQHTRQETQNLGEHTAHWANYLGELVRELPLHYPSWRQVPAEQKAGVMARIGTQFDIRPYMESDRWPLIYATIQHHLQKIYNGKKAALKERHWIPDSDGTYDLEHIRLSCPSHIFEVNWDAPIAFWNDPKNRARATQNKQNRAKSKVMESSTTREYPSLIHTFFLTHTVNGVFLNPEDKTLYEEMLRLQGLDSNTEMGVPYTEDEIMAIVRGGKKRGHILGIGRVLPRQGTIIPPPPLCTHSSDVVKLKKREKALTRHVNMFMKLFWSDDKFSQMLTQLESQPEIGGGSRSGRRGDDE
ncbi:hypothetical protein Tco_0796338 [Tanacetum coccineum]